MRPRSEAPRGASVEEESAGELAGALTVLISVPLALGVFSLIVALMVYSRIGAGQPLGTGETIILIGATALLTIPLALAAGALGAVYGRCVWPPVCCGALIVGTALAIVVPWLIGPLAPVQWTAGITATVAGATALGAGVCAGGWAAGHRRPAHGAV